MQLELQIRDTKSQEGTWSLGASHTKIHNNEPLMIIFKRKSCRLFHNLKIYWAHKAFSLHESIYQHLANTPPVHILPFQDILTLRTALLQLATAKSSDAASAWAQLERMAEDGQADAQAVMASEAWAAYEMVGSCWRKAMYVFYQRLYVCRYVTDCNVEGGVSNLMFGAENPPFGATIHVCITGREERTTFSKTAFTQSCMFEVCFLFLDNLSSQNVSIYTVMILCVYDIYIDILQGHILTHSFHTIFYL